MATGCASPGTGKREGRRGRRWRKRPRDSPPSSTESSRWKSVSYKRPPSRGSPRPVAGVLTSQELRDAQGCTGGTVRLHGPVVDLASDLLGDGSGDRLGCL